MQQRAFMEVPMNMTLSFLFWAVFASYVVHIIDETLIGGGFVAKVREHWWPTYTARMFFFFNAAFLAIVAGCNLAYDLVGQPGPLLAAFLRSRICDARCDVPSLGYAALPRIFTGIGD